MMNFIIQHADAIIVALIFIAGGSIYTFKFLSLSKTQRYQQIRAWLLQAVLLAEKEFGGKTGKLKLSSVYNKFCQTFPWLAKIIPFDVFSKYVDDALEEAKDILNTNTAIAAIVKNSDVSSDSKME